MTIGLIILFLLAWLIGSIIMYLGAAFASIEGRTFGKAFKVVGIAFVVQWLVAWVFAYLNLFLPIIAWLIGVIVSAILGWWITKHIFQTTWGKALLAILFPYIVMVVTMLIFGTTLYTALV